MICIIRKLQRQTPISKVFTLLVMQLYIFLCSRCVYLMCLSVCVQTKLQWLCEEVRERESSERRLRRTLQQQKEQMKALKQSRDSELQSLLDRITQQDRLLKDIQSEKRGTNKTKQAFANSTELLSNIISLF